MEESEKEGKFEYSDIFAYVNDGKYPSEFTANCFSTSMQVNETQQWRD